MKRFPLSYTVLQCSAYPAHSKGCRTLCVHAVAHCEYTYFGVLLIYSVFSTLA